MSPILGSIGGDDPVERLMRQVFNSSWSGNPPERPPSPQQVAYVLHALADHTSLTAAITYTGSDNYAANVGRWLHAYGDTIEFAIPPAGGPAET